MTTETLPKACVILGAGASGDVHGSGSVFIQEAWKPPLAADLFDIERHPNYKEILTRYPGADFLTSQLAPMNRVSGFNLEAELRKLAEHRDPQTRQLFKHIPPYLRDLLWRCSRQYTDRPVCYDQLVFKLLAEHPHEVLFLVLNYDDLLESALRGYNPSFTFDNWADYIDPRRKAKLVKLHGSINWYITIGRGNRTWHSLVDDLDISRKLTDNAVIIPQDVESVQSAVEGGSLLYPLLTAPLAGKGQADLVCPGEHVKTAQEFLKDCKKFLIIGSSGLDDDLLSMLDDAVAPYLNPKIRMMVVGSGQSTDQTLQNFEIGVRAFRSLSRYQDNLLFKNGFREYVSGEGIQSFAKYQPS